MNCIVVKAAASGASAVVTVILTVAVVTPGRMLATGLRTHGVTAVLVMAPAGWCTVAVVLSVRGSSTGAGMSIYLHLSAGVTPSGSATGAVVV